MSIHVMLIDDHAMFRAGLSVLLQSSPGDMQVATADSVSEALDAQATPDVVLLDIRLHGINGLDGLGLLRRKWPGTPIVMLSSDATPQTVQEARSRGAAAFVSKERTADNVAEVILQVLGRTAPADSCGAGEAAGGKAEGSRLTARQAEVLDLLSQGLPNKAIGRRLGLSENTVRVHVQAVLQFLGVSNRSEAAFAARQRGLIG